MQMLLHLLLRWLYPEHAPLPDAPPTILRRDSVSGGRTIVSRVFVDHLHRVQRARLVQEEFVPSVASVGRAIPNQRAFA